MPRISLVALQLAYCLTLEIGVSHAEQPVRWLAHDMERPKPPIVTPAKQNLPALPPADAIVLFGADADLAKWRNAEGGPAKWAAKEGALLSVPGSGYLFSADKFGDVQLHVEWAAPTPAKGRSQGRGNSGIFLMGLYEVQVLDSYQNETYADGQAAAIYGQYPPLVNACLPPGEWQAYDIVFRRPRYAEDGSLARAARMTVIHNGVLVQDDVELWGPTSWLQHKPYVAHPDKLPISLQDHGNPVRYRNIWLRELNEPIQSGALADTSVKAISLTADELKPYLGAYGSILGELGKIELSGDLLQLHMNTGQILELIPTGTNEFSPRHTAGKIVFDKKGDAVVGFTLFLAGDRVQVKKSG